MIAAAVGLGIGLSSSSTKPRAYTAPADGSVVADPYAVPAKDKTTAVAYGRADAPHTLTIFEDFRCPVCMALETGSSSAYKAYVDAGQLRVLFHPVRLIDVRRGGNGSLEAGNASVCAAAAGKFIGYHDVLFAHQPSEETDDFSNRTTLINLAKQVPGLDDPAFESCVNTGTYQGLVQQNWSDYTTMKLPGTPTLILDGKRLTMPDELWKASADGQELIGSDPAVLQQTLQAAGLPALSAAS